MRQPVTIGDQKFVYNEQKKAWVDEKTGVLANQGMQSLLEVAATSMFHPDQETNKVNPAPSPLETPKPNPIAPQSTPEPLQPEKEVSTPDYAGEPVNIGGQKFILDDKKGWVDAKTKQPASKDVVKLLEKITGVKAPTLLNSDKIEIEPIVIGDQKYIWDPKKKEWIDSKTKQRADDALQKLLTITINKAGISKLTDVDTSPLGSVGEAAKEKVQNKENKSKPRKKTSLPVESSKNKRILVDMISKLKSIDSTIRAQSKLIGEENRREYSEARELAVEDASRESNLEKAHAEKVGGGMALPIAAVVAIVATQFEPIRDAVSTAYKSIETGLDYISEAVKSLNSMFESIFSLTGSSEVEGQETSTLEAPEVQKSAAPAPDSTRGRAPPKPVASAPKNVTSEHAMSSTADGPAPRAPSEGGTKKSASTSSSSEGLNTPAQRVAASAPTGNAPRRTMKKEATPRRGWYKGSGTPVDDAKSIVQQMFPKARITSHRRKPGVGKAGSKSWHVKSGAAVDIAPIAGMSFDAWLQHFRSAGYSIIEAIDETISANRRITGGTGPHWHVVLGKGGRPTGPVGTPDGDTMSSDKSFTENAEIGLKTVIDFVRNLGSTDSTYLGSIEAITNHKTNKIGEITAKKYADMVNKNAQDDEEVRKSQVLELPNLNKKGGSTVQTPSTSYDKKVVEQYLRYFGFNPKTLNY